MVQFFRGIGFNTSLNPASIAFLATKSEIDEFAHAE